MAKRIVWTEQAKADVRAIEQPIAIQILKTLGRNALTGEGATKQLKGVTPPLIRLRTQDHRVFFRDHGDYVRSNASSIARTPTAERRALHISTDELQILRQDRSSPLRAKKYRKSKKSSPVSLSLSLEVNCISM